MHKCNGKWELIPELSFYEQGEPPLNGEYEIRVEENRTQFRLRWKPTNGEEMQIEFGGVADGIARDVATPPGAQASYTLIDERTLDSAMFVNGVELAYARRVVSDCNSLMAVLQSNVTASGERIRITQVYRRISS